MQIEKDVPVTFTVEDAAKILSVSRSQVYVLIKTGEIESVKIRGSRRITENQLVRYIKRIETQISGNSGNSPATKSVRTPIESNNKRSSEPSTWTQKTSSGQKDLITGEFLSGILGRPQWGYGEVPAVAHCNPTLKLVSYKCRLMGTGTF